MLIFPGRLKLVKHEANVYNQNAIFKYIQSSRRQNVTGILEDDIIKCKIFY